MTGWSVPIRRTTALAVVLVLAGGTAAGAQEGTRPDLRPEGAATPRTDAVRAVTPHPLTTPVEIVEARLAAEVDSLVRAALVLPGEERKEVALRADSVARVLVDARPASADAHHWRAVTAGVLAEVSGVAEKIRLGRESWEGARHAVALDSLHAGAHHVLGRVHTGVLRLPWIARFFAGRMGLGELVGAASWDDARLHLARAVELAPDEMSFRYELASVLAERGDPETARAHLRDVLAEQPSDPLEQATQERAGVLLETLGEGTAPDG